MHRLQYTSTDDAQVDANILPLSFKVPGRIAKLYVSEGDAVSRGQKLAELDSTDYTLAAAAAEARLDAVRLDLEKARAQLELTRTTTDIRVLETTTSLDQVEGGVSISATRRDVNLDNLRSAVSRAEINVQAAREWVNQVAPLLDQALVDQGRAARLFQSGVVSAESAERARTQAEVLQGRLAQARQSHADAKKQLDAARNNLRSAQIDTLQVGIAENDRHKAGLALDLSRDQRDKQIRMAETAVKTLEARVRELEAGRDAARQALADTVLISPARGVVAKKLSLAPEVVAAGKPVLFVVDTSDIWVAANIEEKHLGNIRATVTFDVLPGKTFRGRVRTIGAAANSKFSLIPSGNTSGTFIKVSQRVPIKISLQGDVSRLKPGTNAVVSIKND